MLKEARLWFQAQPFCTRWGLALSTAIPLAIHMKIVPIEYVLFLPHRILKGQLWRPLLAPFITVPGMGYLFGLVARYQYSVALETDRFLGKSVDYFWFLFLMALLLSAMNMPVGLYTLWDALSMTIVYLWSKDNAEAIVNYMFGFRFRVLEQANIVVL